MPSAAMRLSLLYAALFFELGINLPFFPVWLRAQSLDDGSIGLIVAAPLLARILANPLATAFADRRSHIGGTLTACAIAVMIATPLLFVTNGFASILFVVLAIALAQGPLIALADTLALVAPNSVSNRTIDYGRVRLWGSIAFALANLSAGLLLVWLPPNAIIGLLTISAVMTVLVAVAATRLPLGVSPHAVREVERIGNRHWRIVLVVAGAACVQASHGMVYAFSTLHWQSEGLSSVVAGTLWALGVVSEIALFAVAGRFLGGAMGPALLLLGGASMAIVRWLGMALDPGIMPLAILQLSHGLTFGATHIGSILMLSRLAPAGMQAQVQGWLAATWAGLMAILMTVSGQFYGSWGEHTYLMMAAVAGFGLLLLCGAVAGQGAREEHRVRLL